MKTNSIVMTACATLVLLTSAFAQNWELTPHVGGQINGGLDLTTSLFHRFEVANGVTTAYHLAICSESTPRSSFCGIKIRLMCAPNRLAVFRA